MICPHTFDDSPEGDDLCYQPTMVRSVSIDGTADWAEARANSYAPEARFFSLNTAIDLFIWFCYKRLS